MKNTKSDWFSVKPYMARVRNNRGLFKTFSNIDDRVFFAKIVNGIRFYTSS